MDQVQTELTTTLTEHAMLVVWGAFAHQIGLIDRLAQVPIPQRQRDYTPQTKLIEFLMAILGGCAYLQDISHGTHPLDQDQAVAAAWRQPGWADYSGVSRTLRACTAETIAAVRQVLQEVSQPFIDREVMLAIKQRGVIVYDGDLTARPVSNSSHSYPEARFGWMSDQVGLGFQVALVSMHSPTYGRLWLASQHHPGDVVASSQAEALVRAAEAATGVRPPRRTKLLRQRLPIQQQVVQAAETARQQADQAVKSLIEHDHDLGQLIQTWQSQVAQLSQQYTQKGKAERPYSQLTKARQKLQTYQRRQQRRQVQLTQAQQRLQQAEAAYQAAQADLTTLTKRLQQFEQDNQTNPNPIQAIIRLDAGFGTGPNVTLLIELGYEVYSKPANHWATAALRRQVTPDQTWEKVGDNAVMVAWSQAELTHCPYPLDLALERFYTGQTVRYSSLLHYGSTPVTQDLPAWFNEYNARQTIEAGIKEGKGVFQMHHLFVQSEGGILLQELFTPFAANLVRWAAHWLCQTRPAPSSPLTSAQPQVKNLVRLAANTSAWVIKQPQGCWLQFTDLSAYPGLELAIPDGWAFQPPLRLFNCKSAIFSP